MRDNHSLDAVLGTLSATGTSEVPADFMDGVWQRAGQLGEIADRRRRTALFVGLLSSGLELAPERAVGPGLWRLPRHLARSILGEQLSHRRSSMWSNRVWGDAYRSRGALAALAGCLGAIAADLGPIKAAPASTISCTTSSP